MGGLFDLGSTIIGQVVERLINRGKQYLEAGPKAADIRISNYYWGDTSEK